MDMRIKEILLILAALIVAAGCSKTYKDINVTSFELVSVSPYGQREGTALVKVGLDNPIAAFELLGASATLKVGDAPCATISTDQLMVSAKCVREYLVPVRVEIPEGANLFELLNMLKASDAPLISMDVSGKVAMRGGMGVNVNRNISLSDKMDFAKYVSSLEGKSFMDFTITALELCSVKTRESDMCEILLKLGVSNPYVGFEVSSLSGILKLDGVNGIELYDKDLTVVSKGDNVYYLTFDGKISGGFNPCILLSILKSSGAPALTADFAARIAARGGLGKTFRWNDISLGSASSLNI